MSGQQKQEDANKEDIVSIEGSEWSVEEENIVVGHGNAKQKEESNSKIALLEANNKILEGKLENLEAKLENLELKAQIRAMTEEANLNKLKEENTAIWARMEAAEEKANNLGSTIKEIQQKMDESLKEMVDQFCRSLIQTEQQLKGQKQDMEDLKAKNLKEMANLKERLKSQGINLDQIKLDIPWSDLIKDKKVANPKGNGWTKSTDSTVIVNGLNATSNCKVFYKNCCAVKEFRFSDEACRENNFSGIIIYYFEITKMSSNSSGRICVGLSNGYILHLSSAINSPNYYALWDGCYRCYLSGKRNYFQWPTGGNKPKWNGQGDVVGCGILMSPANKMSIFFTLNGTLLGKKIPIGHPGDSLFPTARLFDASVEANFGDDLTNKPFRYDIDKCPGLDIE